MISDIFTWWRKICWKFISVEYKSGKDGCKTRLEAAIISDILFIWSGKFNFYQEKVREFWKVMPVATMKDTCYLTRREICFYWIGDAAAFDQEWKERTRQSSHMLRDRQRATIRGLEGMCLKLSKRAGLVRYWDAQPSDLVNSMELACHFFSFFLGFWGVPFLEWGLLLSFSTL